MFSVTNQPALWTAIGSILAAIVVTRGADLVSKRQERQALTGGYTDLLAQTRAHNDNQREEIESQREEITQLRRVIAVLRRRIVVLRHALVTHGQEVPPDPEDADS